MDPVNLNTATDVQLAAIPGFGAARIETLKQLFTRLGRDVTLEEVVDAGIPRALLNNLIQEGKIVIEPSEEEEGEEETDIQAVTAAVGGLAQQLQAQQEAMKQLTEGLKSLHESVITLGTRADQQRDSAESMRCLLESHQKAVENRLGALEAEVNRRHEADVNPYISFGRGFGRGSRPPTVKPEFGFFHSTPGQYDLQAPAFPGSPRSKEHPAQAHLDAIERSAPGDVYVPPSARASRGSNTVQRGGISHKRERISQLAAKEEPRSASFSSRPDSQHSEDAEPDDSKEEQVSLLRSIRDALRPAPASRPAQTPAPPKMATFDGKEGTAADWRAFILQFELAADRYGWNADERRDRLVQSLRGGASVFFSRLPHEVRGDYRTLLQRLMSRFGKKDPPTTVRRQIGELRQRKNESLEAFADRARELALDGYPEATEAILETVAADAFLTGCTNKEAVFQALQQRPETISKALELVREATHNHRAVYGATEPKVRSVEHDISEPEVRQVASLPPNKPTDSAGNSLDRLSEQLSQVIKLLSVSAQPAARAARPRTRSPSPGDTCFRCGKSGHFRQNCPETERPKVQFKLPTGERDRSPSPARPLNAKGSSAAAGRS